MRRLDKLQEKVIEALGDASAAEVMSITLNTAAATLSTYPAEKDEEHIATTTDLLRQLIPEFRKITKEG